MTMDDKNKLAKAKDNYTRFLERVNKVVLDEDNELVSVIIRYRDGSTDMDYYWSDNELTPTAIQKWIKTNYNRHTTPRTKWLSEVLLEDKEYKQLSSMVSGDEIIIDDVKILLR